jgi:tetratricopeptide (TPR) repeat protein
MLFALLSAAICRGEGGSNTPAPGVVITNRVTLISNAVVQQKPIVPWQYPEGTNEAGAKKPSIDYGAQLSNARAQRAELHYKEATTIYSWILEQEAPVEFQQSALLELAEMARDQDDLMRAQQVYAQWIARWPQDIRVPEMVLYQGLIFRKLGLNSLAIAKFYAVMTTALVIKSDRFDYYQQLVLRAQNEIAETQYELGNFAEAAESFSRLLKLDPPPVNRPAVHYLYIECLAGLGRRAEVVAQAEDFLRHNAKAAQRAEVHFLRANALKDLHRETEALQEVLDLLKEQREGTNSAAGSLAYWQRRAGNAIANQFYQEGEPLKALEIYKRLATLDPEPSWQLPVQYQMGLIYERLAQPARAVECYTAVISCEKALGEKITPGLKTVIDMANWRKEFLGWQLKAEQTNMQFRAVSMGLVAPQTPPPQ